MIPRSLASLLIQDLSIFPVVAILGSRQSGKTTLGRWISESYPKKQIYLDLELPSDRLKLENAEFYLKNFFDHLIIIDEIQRKPELFPLLRSIIDQRKRKGEKSGQFLIMGSSSQELIRFSSESLAGRIAYRELTPFILEEINDEKKLWLQGGYPESFLAEEKISFQWRENYIITLIERDIPMMIGDYPSDRMFRLWRILSQDQGGIVNFSKIGGNLGITGVTVRSYIEKMIGLFLFRFLPPWTGNVSRRLVKSPKLYFRDSGILHQLLGIETFEDLLNSPHCGDSWEGFVIEQILTKIPKSTFASFYRSATGDEIDLVLETNKKKTIAIEIKLSPDPKISSGFYKACETIGAKEKHIIIPGNESYQLANDMWVWGLENFIEKINKSF